MARALPISEVKAHLPELVGEYARLRETLDILADADLLADVRAGRAYFRRGGKGVPLDEALPSTRPPKKAKRRRS